MDNSFRCEHDVLDYLLPEYASTDFDQFTFSDLNEAIEAFEKHVRLFASELARKSCGVAPMSHCYAFDKDVVIEGYMKRLEDRISVLRKELE